MSIFNKAINELKKITVSEQYVVEHQLRIFGDLGFQNALEKFIKDEIISRKFTNTFDHTLVLESGIENFLNILKDTFEIALNKDNNELLICNDDMFIHVLTTTEHKKLCLNLTCCSNIDIKDAIFYIENAFSSIISKDSYQIIINGNIRQIEMEKNIQKNYPYIGNIHSYIESIIKDPAPLIILSGEAGTGKTRLIKQILATYCKIYKLQSIKCLQEFGEGSISSAINKFNDDTKYHFLVLDEADDLLKSGILDDKKSGLISALLSVTDPFFERPANQKIIICGNCKIENGYLTRKGRCAGVIETNKLTPEQAEELLAEIHPDKNIEDVKFHVESHGFQTTSKSYSLAEVYNA